MMNAVILSGASAVDEARPQHQGGLTPDSQKRMSLANLRAAFHIFTAWSEGRSLVRVNKHAINSRPEIMPAFARAAVANPTDGLLRRLLSIMGWTTAPREEPVATIVIARARRL